MCLYHLKMTDTERIEHFIDPGTHREDWLRWAVESYCRFHFLSFPPVFLPLFMPLQTPRQKWSASLGSYSCRLTTLCAKSAKRDSLVNGTWRSIAEHTYYSTNQTNQPIFNQPTKYSTDSSSGAARRRSGRRSTPALNPRVFTTARRGLCGN